MSRGTAWEGPLLAHSNQPLDNSAQQRMHVAHAGGGGAMQQGVTQQAYFHASAPDLSGWAAQPPVRLPDSTTRELNCMMEEMGMAPCSLGNEWHSLSQQNRSDDLRLDDMLLHPFSFASPDGPFYDGSPLSDAMFMDGSDSCDLGGLECHVSCPTPEHGGLTAPLASPTLRPGSGQPCLNSPASTIPVPSTGDAGLVPSPGPAGGTALMRPLWEPRAGDAAQPLLGAMSPTMPRKPRAKAKVPAKKTKTKRVPQTQMHTPRVPSAKLGCANCGTESTPQWRAGPGGAGTLCNACGLRYKKGYELTGMAATEA